MPATKSGRRLWRAVADSDPDARPLIEDIQAAIVDIEAEAKAAAVQAGVEVIIAGTGWRLFELDDATGWRCVDDEAGIVVDAPTPTAAIAATIQRVAEEQG